MAQALLSSFDEWVRSLLNALQSNGADMSDFVQYLTGIITSESETDEEKQQAIAELLADLDLKHGHDIDALSHQILDRWNNLANTTDHPSDTMPPHRDDDDAMSAALINAMNRLESSARQNRHGTDNKLTDDAASKKHKSHVLAKYSEISDEELDYGEEVGTPDNGLFHNTNSQDIDDREKKVRELQQEAHKKQQERNKTDASTQKQKDEDRKKKAQQRTQKQERRR